MQSIVIIWRIPWQYWSFTGKGWSNMLKKQRLAVNQEFKKYFILLIIIWLVSLLLLSIFSYRKFANGIETELGDKAVCLAQDIAVRYSLTSDQVESLFSLEFQELLNNPINVEFENKAREVMKNSDIKYIYLQLPILDQTKIKYKVESGEEELYNAPPGKPLNVIYLLDAVINDETRLDDTGGYWYTDKDRYTVMDEKFKASYEKRGFSYHLNSDRWGNYLTGYAPFYDNENNYLGLIGVDLFLDRHNSFLQNYIYLLLFFILINLAIGILSIHLTFKVRTAKKEIQEKTELSYLDDLTGIFNRRRFRELLKEEWQKALRDKKVISLLLIDIDYFKEYNDNYGHIAGDQVLKKIATALRDGVEWAGGVLARYGGDEFVVLMPEIDLDRAEKLANSLVKKTNSLGIQHRYSPISNCQTVSVGVAAITPEPGMQPEVLIERADEALYKSKRYGRNRISTG